MESNFNKASNLNSCYHSRCSLLISTQGILKKKIGSNHAKVSRKIVILIMQKKIGANHAKVFNSQNFFLFIRLRQGSLAMQFQQIKESATCFMFAFFHTSVQTFHGPFVLINHR